MRRKLFFVFCSVIALFFLVLAVWRPICLEFQVFRAEKKFRWEYAKSGNPQTILVDLDWAHEFAGNCGRNALIAIIEDQTITDEGRHKAKTILQLIDFKFYLRDLQERRAQGQFFFNSWYLDYIASQNGEE